MLRKRTILLVYLMRKQSIIGHICQVALLHGVGKLMLVSGLDDFHPRFNRMTGHTLVFIVVRTLCGDRAGYSPHTFCIGRHHR